MKTPNAAAMPATRVLVLHQEVAADAPPDERDTLVQVDAVENALTRLGFNVDRAPFNLELATVIERLHTSAPILVFNLVESVAGEQRLATLAPSLLEALDIPFTGNGSRSSRLTGDKLRTKRLLRAAGLPTAEWWTLSELSVARAAPSGTWMLKPVSEDASAGMSSELALTAGATLAEALRACAGRSGGQWFAERYIEGRELNVALLQGEKGPQVLPIAEIRFRNFPPGMPRILDYAAKWDPSSFAYRHTPRHFDFDPSDGPLLEHLEEIGRACWDLFDLAGYARVDVRVDADGVPWILEINANPCLAPDAGFMAAAGEDGLRFDEVVARLVGAARTGLQQAPTRPASSQKNNRDRTLQE